MAIGHVILREFHLDRSVPYFDDYARRYTDLPMLVRLVRRDGRLCAGAAAARRRFRRRSGRGQQPGMENGGVRRGRQAGRAAGLGRLPLGRAGQMEPRGQGEPRRATSSLRLSLAGDDAIARGRLPLFRRHAPPTASPPPTHPDVLTRNVPVRSLALKDGETLVATVFDLLCANYGLDRGLGGDNVAHRLRRRQALHPGLGRARHRRAARRTSSMSRANSPTNAEKTNGRSMVILGAGLNHWYHMDMAYRGIINLLVLCGCVGQSRRRLVALCRPGKAAPADRLGCRSPSRSTGAARRASRTRTSFFYAHTDQWRYETLNVVGNPVADRAGRRLERQR